MRNGSVCYCYNLFFKNKFPYVKENINSNFQDFLINSFRILFHYYKTKPNVKATPVLNIVCTISYIDVLINFFYLTNCYCRFVIIAMEAMDQLLVACHAQTLNLFVESFLKMVQKLLESTEPQLQILATQSVSQIII